MAFDELVQVRSVKKRTGKLRIEERGCEFCPLDKVPGIHKIMGHVDGHDILIVAQSPGPEENEVGKELVGKSGQFLWDEMKKVGIRRGDCDKFNAVKCFTADATEGSYSSYLKMRNPAVQEIHCCSVHTEALLAQSKAKHILILGQIAAKAFLETRSVPKQRIFWSDKYKAKIYLADHPAFFVRGYGAGARLESFRSTLSQLASDWKNQDARPRDDFAFLRAQDYRLVTTASEAEQAARIIKAYAAKGRRTSVDIEYDVIDGVQVIFVVGFCPKPGLSFVHVFDWSAVEQSADDTASVKASVRDLLRDPKIRKVLHYGCSDVTGLQKDHVAVAGYDWDTNFGEYLYYPDEKMYGLEAIAERRFQQFSGYKTIVVDDLMAGLDPGTVVPSAVLNGTPAVKLKWLAKKSGQYHLSRLKPDTMRLYNGGDDDLTKRIEVDTKKLVPGALVKLYIDLSFVLTAMEANGPWFDKWQHAQVNRLWPYLENKALQKLREMVGNPEFNPGSPAQVYWAVYDHFGLVYPLSKGNPNTQKKTLMMLSREHPFPMAIINWRRLSKAKSTYINGQYACAAKFGGRLKTTWWATGTATGRLSSSGGDEGGINLQNLHGDSRLQNMCVADLRWRKVFNAITDIRKHQPEEEWAICIEAWIRSCMPDLKTFLVLDYGQVEVRVAAQLSGDKNLLKDCESSDIHSLVGHAMTNWPVEKIKHDKKTRTLTKNCHFGILFGIAKHNLYEFIKAMDPDSDVTEEFVSTAFDNYFARYPGMAAFIEKQREFAQANGYVETIFGLHRTLNVTEQHGAFDNQDDGEYVDASGESKASWKNQAINTPVQGSAHQLMECGLVNFRRKHDYYAVLGLPSLEVHDALYFMVNVLDLHECYVKAKYLMEKESLNTLHEDFPDIDWKVPIIVEAEAGLRLGGKVDLPDDKFTIGGFMLSWYQKTKKQILELRGQLAEIPDEVETV